MELVANDTVHTSFVSVRHVFVENHFVQNLDSQCAHCHRFPSHSTASKRATTTRWRCISATASVIHMRSTAYDAPSVVSSVSSLAACGLPCCARMAPQCPSVWVSFVAFFAIERLRAPSVPSRLRVQESTMWSIAGWAFQEGPPCPCIGHSPPRVSTRACVRVCAPNATPLRFLIRNHADLHLPRRLSLGASRRPGGLRDRRRSPAVCT